MISADTTSWIPGPQDSHFPIQNIPFGIALLDGRYELVTRVGDTAVRLAKLVEAKLLTVPLEEVAGPRPDLLQKTPAAVRAYRIALVPWLESDSKPRSQVEKALMPVSDLEMVVPKVTAFVDFYSGINHASNVGRMFRPDMPPLLPNYRWLPVAYNGRASSVVSSGTPITRPKGQTMGKDAQVPEFGPSKELDFELEMGFYVGSPTKLGETVPIGKAEDSMIGFVLVNDWSARDVQRWEYQPLGPFLAKSFATSISPWVVTVDALEPFRIQGPVQEPAPLPHLCKTGMHHFDIHLEVLIKTPKMTKPERISLTNFRELYWSPAQQLAHQSSNGTPLEAGDLYGSGTISGTEPGTFGSLLELTWRGANPISLGNGEVRTFLQDGDELIMTGWCERNGLRVGFGEVRGTILPSTP